MLIVVVLVLWASNKDARDDVEGLIKENFGSGKNDCFRTFQQG